MKYTTEKFHWRFIKDHFTRDMISKRNLDVGTTLASYSVGE